MALLANQYAANNPSDLNPAVNLAVGVVPRADGFGNATDPWILEFGATAFCRAALTTVVTGGPATLTVLLEGSMDGQNWFTVATSTSLTGDTQFAPTNFNTPTVQFGALRVRVSVLTGGASPKIALAVTAFAS